MLLLNASKCTIAKVTLEMSNHMKKKLNCNEFTEAVPLGYPVKKMLEKTSENLLGIALAAVLF